MLGSIPSGAKEKGGIGGWSGESSKVPGKNRGLGGEGLGQVAARDKKRTGQRRKAFLVGISHDNPGVKQGCDLRGCNRGRVAKESRRSQAERGC